MQRMEGKGEREGKKKKRNPSQVWPTEGSDVRNNNFTNRRTEGAASEAWASGREVWGEGAGKTWGGEGTEGPEAARGLWAVCFLKSPLPTPTPTPLPAREQWQNKTVTFG